MSVYEEFPTTHFIQGLDPREGVPRERRMKAIPAAAMWRYYTVGVGFNLDANWDELKTLDELTPVYKPAEEVKEMRKRQLIPQEWANIFTARPYTVVGNPGFSHPYYDYFDTADAWLKTNREWLHDTYDIGAFHDLTYVVSIQVSNIERDKARESGANVGP